MKKVTVSEYQIEKVRKAMKASGLDPDGLSDSDIVDQAMTAAAMYFSDEEDEDEYEE